MHACCKVVGANEVHRAHEHSLLLVSQLGAIGDTQSLTTNSDICKVARYVAYRTCYLLLVPARLIFTSSSIWVTTVGVPCVGSSCPCMPCTQKMTKSQVHIAWACSAVWCSYLMHLMHQLSLLRQVLA